MTKLWFNNAAAPARPVIHPPPQSRRPTPVHHGAALSLACAIAMFSGCEQPDAPGAPSINYGVDHCAVCDMVINDRPASAALQVRTKAGREFRLFDDIGEMLDFEQEDDALPVLGRFVHDQPSAHWIAAGAATYVMSDQIQTPMSSGIVAFQDAAAAKAFAASKQGRVLTLEEARLARESWREARYGK